MKIADKLFLVIFLMMMFSCKTIIIPQTQVKESLQENLHFTKISEPASLPDKLDLHQAQKIALRNNPGLKAAEQRILRAKAIVQQAQALYWPSLKATFSARHYHHVPQNRIPFPTQPYEAYQSALSSQWLVFDGLARDYKALAARYGTMAAEEGLHDSQRLLANAVSQAFYQTILSQKQMRINLELKNINLKFLEDTKAQKAAGTATQIAVNNFQVNANDSHIAYLEAQNSFETAKVVLAELLGVPTADTSSFEAIFKTKTINVPDKNTAIQTALDKRPDLKALQSEILAMEAQLNEARAEYSPKFYLEGSYGTSSFNELRLGDDKRDSYIGAAMSWDLFTGNSSAALIAQRRAEKEEKLKLLRSRWLEVVSEIRQQRQSLLNVLDKLTVQTQTTSLAKSIYDDTKIIYESGATSITRVNEVLANYSVAKLNQALFEVEARRRESTLESLMGVSLQ